MAVLDTVNARIADVLTEVKAAADANKALVEAFRTKIAELQDQIAQGLVTPEEIATALDQISQIEAIVKAIDVTDPTVLPPAV